MAPLRKIFDGAYSTSEVARIFRISRHRLALLIASEQFVPSRVGHDGMNTRWTQDDVERLRSNRALMRQLKRPKQAIAQ